MRRNNNIKVIKVHSVNIEFRNEKINLFALSKNIITPQFINGLVMVLWHAINQEKKKIEIYGADFSLFKEYYIDQSTNELYNSASHFYKIMHRIHEPKKMMHTEFNCFIKCICCQN